MKKLFSIFAAVLFAGSMMAGSITISHNQTSTGNLVAGENNAAKFKDAEGTTLDALVWYVAAVKNDAQAIVGVNKDGTTRLYATNSEDANTTGNALTVSLSGGTIKSVSLNLKQGGDNLSVLAGDAAVAIEGGLYPINGTTFTLKNVGAKGTGQVQINSFTVNYLMEGEEEIKATAVELNKTELTLEQYREETLEATLVPENASNVVSWLVADPAVAEVSAGLVKALKVGATTITAKADEGVTKDCALTVVEATALTCAKAADYAATVSANNEKYPGGQYVVEGYAISMSTSNGYIWLADDAAAEKGTFEVYQPSNKSEIADVKKGDKIRAHGYISKYNTTYEFLSGCVFEILTDEPTGFENTEIEAKAVKFFENGQLVIIKGGVKYNATGAVIK